MRRVTKGIRMRSSHFVTLLVGTGAVVLAGLASAHHSQAGIFDSRETIEVKATVRAPKPPAAKP